MPALDQSVDGSNDPMFRAYNLETKDGVQRVGSAERESNQNLVYEYVEDDFTKTFYSSNTNNYTSGSNPPSAQGTAYMLREVVDYLSATYSATTLTWYDVFTRMPITRMGEMVYDSNSDLISDIANGLRGGIIIQNIEKAPNNSSRVLADDAKTVVTLEDRNNVNLHII